MIKFFRRIRRKLVSENKFSKYLLYAIGEIVLVVIGILIALSINTWNQNRNNRELELNYISRLIEDFEKDSAILESTMENTKSRINLGKSVISTLESGKLTESPIQFAKAIEYSMWFNYPNYSSSTYSDLLSTGNLRLIQDTNLKDKLSNYYTTITFTEQWKDNFRKIQQDLENIIPKVLTLEEREFLYYEQRKDSISIGKELEINEIDAHRMLESLSNIANAKYLYSNMVRVQIVHYSGLENINKLTKEILNELRSYLKEID